MSESVKIFLDTYGCQMNFYDGELVAGLLEENGFAITFDPSEADVILINTCSVRDHAEQRALGRLRTLAAQKRHRPRLILGVLGCMAERLVDSLGERVPGVDLILGPGAYRKLPEILGSFLKTEGGCSPYFAEDSGETYDEVKPRRGEGVNAWVAVMRGCDNFCAYCIVPYVRGRARCRRPEVVIDEVERAVSEGYPEVTLLGQNVNSYRFGEVDFSDLLGRVARVKGLKRLRFLTSHPRDLSDKLIDRLSEGGVICSSLHLPLQSGSDKILKAMNRGYTSSDYLERIAKLRSFVPDIMLTTDLLCGFPGERERDFQNTLELAKQARFDDAFTFKYSLRPGTAAAKMEDDVPEEVKLERLERMIAVCRQMADESRRQLIGKEVEVLLERRSPKSPSEWTGRTVCDRVALVPGDFHAGDLVVVKVERVRGFSLWGRAV